jgi:hypothetical protein
LLLLLVGLSIGMGLEGFVVFGGMDITMALLSLMMELHLLSCRCILLFFLSFTLLSLLSSIRPLSLSLLLLWEED